MINILNILIVIRDFIKQYKVVIAIILLFVVIISVIKKCEKEPKTVIETKVVIKRDTIIQTKIKEVPKIVYVNKYIDKQGEKVIVYVDKPTDSTTIKANQYTSTVNSNDAEAKLKITTTGTLLDVQGVIEYPETTITKTITKYKSKSGLFVYGLAPLNTNQINIEAGLIYQFKNSFMLMGGAQYNDIRNSADLKIGIGFKIF